MPDARVDTVVCTGCGTVLDVEGVEAFSEVVCPNCESSMRVPVPFGPFLMVDVLGRGGMGAVYKAYDPSLDRYVAIKIILREYGEDAKALAGFHREARAAAALNHTHIVHIYTFGQREGLPYIAMELLEGGRLDVLMKGSDPLSEARVMDIGSQVAEGLQAAYEAGLTHGDIKPGNILFDGKGTVKLSDFGLAAFVKRDQERPTEIWGTPYYIAPEKVRRKPFDHRADIYSLGGTLFHALTGRAPFLGADAKAVVMARLDQPAPDPGEIRDDLTEETARVLRRMLEENPSRRHPTYASLLADLRSAHHEAARAEREAALRAAERLRPGNRARSKGAGLRLAVLTVVLAAAALYHWWPGRSAEPERQVHHYEMRGGRMVPVYEDEVRDDEERVRQAEADRRAETRRILEGALSRLGAGDPAAAREEAAGHFPRLPVADPDRVLVGLVDAVCAACMGDLEASRQSARALLRAVPDPIPSGVDPHALAAVRALADPAEPLSDVHRAAGEVAPVLYWVAGLNALHAGDTAAAGLEWTEFLEAAGRGSLWAEALAPSARAWLEALETWRREEARAAELPAEEAVPALEAAGQQAIPLLAPSIEAALAEARGRMEVERTDARARLERERVEREARDAPRLAAAVEGRLDRVRSRDFGALIQPLDEAAPTLESEAGRESLALERERAERLIALQRFLIQRINTTPFAQPIEELGGRLARADHQGLYVAAVDGGERTPWDRISTRLFLSLFDYLLGAAPADAAEKADLCLSMAVYCDLLGGERAAARYRAWALELDPATKDRAARLFPVVATETSADSPQPEGDSP